MLQEILDSAPEFEFPEKLSFLLTEPARLKVLYGGRNASKTESIARGLIIFATQHKLRIACFRELQTSIAESVHQTISLAIEDMNLSHEFDITDKSIISKRTGSEFIFLGLRYNINKIKSLARIDIAWVEEAVNVSKTSWDKLEPTIRGRSEDDPKGMGGPFGQGPEIWISFNPELDTDETYKRFVVKRDLYAPDFDKDGKRYAFVVKVNWSDNKWFPPDQRRLMELAKLANEDDYLHVWEGHTKQTLEGAIYSEEIKRVLVDGRRGIVKYDPTRPVYTFWDLGHSDKTAIWFIQRVGVEYNVINYYQNRLQKLPHYLEYMQSLGYVYSTCYMPHDADNETLASRSISSLARKAGFKVIVVQRPSKKVVGINAARTVFPLCNFDEENTADGWQCLTHYAYKIDEDGKWSREPEHDSEWSHGCFTADTKVLTREGPKAISTLPEKGEVLTQWGWMNYQNPHLTRKNALLVEVQFIGGYTVKCTPDHLFLTEKGWKSAQSLERGLLIQSGLPTTNNILMEEFTPYAINILTAPIDFTETFGRMLLEKYQKVVTYIIETKINKIINCIISNVFQLANIFLIPVFVNGKMEDLYGFQSQQENWPLFGINQKKAGNGIENKLKQFGKRNLKIVSNVIRNSNVYLSKNIVLQNVQSWIIKKKEQLKQLLLVHGLEIEFANVVVKNLFTKEKEAVEINSFAHMNVGKLLIKNVENLTERADVYCLTVPNCGHFSLANGAIVKNCDGFQTFALSLTTEVAAKPRTVTTGTRIQKMNVNKSSSWMR